MRIRREVFPFVRIAAAASACVGFGLKTDTVGILLFLIATAYLLYFFRDPERTPPSDQTAVLAGADVRVMSVKCMKESKCLKTESVRISFFLSLFDVHVNRAPIAGDSIFIGYFAGRNFLAFQDEASELNRHNKILIEGLRTHCLVCQIAGTAARRVVYWLNREAPTPVKAGDRIGMMKFGSRLDILLPAADVDVLVKSTDKIRAEETVIARIKPAENK